MIEPEAPAPPQRRHWLAISLRTMMVVVLLVGGLLGWVAHRARVRREAVAAVLDSGGQVFYDWKWADEKPVRNGQPRGHPWLRARLGPEFFDDVTWVDLRGPKADDAVMARVGELTRIERMDIGLGPRAALQPTAITDAGLAHLRELTRLRFLYLYAPTATGASLASLGGLTRLQNLTLAGFPIGDADLAHLRRLTELDWLRNFPHRGEPRDPRAPRRGDPSEPRITDAGMEYLRGLKKLRSLVLSDTAITAEGLRPLLVLPRLRNLSLDGSRIESLTPLATMTRLEVLNVAGSGVASIEPIRGLTRLKTLVLRGTPIDDAGLAPVGDLAALEGLYLQGTRITDASLARLGRHPSLWYLDLSGTAITDDGLADLAGMARLKALLLDDTAITDAGLARLAGSATLKQVSVRGTRITPAGVAALLKANPGLRVAR